GYHMKHGAIVKANGSFDFSRADETIAKAGIPVFGHVLAWHVNNNGDYLRSLATSVPMVTGKNLLTNGDFEDATESTTPGWVKLVGGNSEGNYSIETTNLEPNIGGKIALKVTVIKAGTNAWDMQALGPNFVATQGKQYKVSASIKSLTGGGKVKLVIQNANYLENQLSFTDNKWNTFVWNVTINETNPQFKLHFNGEGTYVIDNIKVEELGEAQLLNTTEIAKNVDASLKAWVKGTMSHFKNVKSWDVVNEVYTDGTPSIRTGASSGDKYYWAQYLGRAYIAKTFNYARENCSDCELFINDYNLEFSVAKLDSTIGLVKELQAQKVPVTGIGTQMHMSINTSRDNITNMFKKMAATGLKVRISELDISINPNNVAGFAPTAALYETQAAMFEFVVKSYIQNVPAAQRHGITVWGVSDKDSWIISTFNRPDFPLMWDANFAKKPAYVGFMNGLK
ncbi:MAG: endo-1,4-beta-xylanase, partial [Emticicia sp.]|nr:endo-1,4-beta-xylanase [Emticicia sp.]